MSKFSDRIRILRAERDLSLRQLSGITGISPSALHSYETGTREPSHRSLEALSDVFNCDIDYLLGKTNQKRSTKLKVKDLMNRSIDRCIFRYRKEHDLTQKEFADLIQVDESYVAKIESGEIKPENKVLYRICDLMETSASRDMKSGNITLLPRSYLESSLDYYEYEDSKTTSNNAYRIPVLGYVAAGIPISAIEDIIDYEELAPDMVKDGAEYFALQIKGQSMEPKISDGDVVIVRKQPDVDSGQIAIVCVNGDEATCKKIMKQDTGILLLPLNPAFAPTFYSNEDIENIPITILGRVVELRAKF